MTEPQRIQALPLHLANQIAAGEVIERPASVIKELIENSLDAGATHITLNIEGAGSQLIKVRDDGQGIHPKDLSLALSRHATSKLNSSEQLSHIASLGFRGEALPSIASVSRLSISSKQANNEHAWQYNDHTEELSPVSHANGTTVTVQELFFNVPARRHFLRGEKTELNHIITTLHRLALSQFDTAFDCQFSSSQRLKLPVADTPVLRQQRIAKLCGQTFLNNSIYLTQQYDAISLEGWVSDTQGHRPQTDVHYFFINGRVIRDRVINHAIRQAYADILPEGRYPGFVLYLTMPLDQLDINVHPTKHEVRFREPRLIHGLLNKAISEALANVETDASSEITQPQQQNFSHFVSTENVSAAASISESQTHYNPQLLSSASSPTVSAQPTSLLYQRYLLLETDTGPTLLDIQSADREYRQQQFQQAITTNTLSSRPILVPLQCPLDSAAFNLFTKFQSKLSELGLTYQLQDKVLTLKSIPSLLAGSDLNQLIESLAVSIQADMDTPVLGQLLQQHIPLTAITSLSQAEQLLKQLPPYTEQADWVCALDKTTLQNLFKQTDA